MDSLVFYFYRTLFAPLFILGLRFARPFLKGKIREIVDQRSNPQWPTMSARPILLHAASGEVEYAKPVLRELKRRYPQIPILLTYFSPSALRLLSDVDTVDMIWPLPFDGVRPMSRFLKNVNPRMVLFSRTDVWPEMVYQCQKMEIPSYLFSATLAKNSSRSKFPARALSRYALNQLHGIFCVSEEDRTEFSDLGVRAPVEVMGDSRFDQVLYRLQNPRTLKRIFGHKDAQKVFVIGSSWEADENILIAALLNLSLIMRSSFKMIWAPHETNLEHLAQLRKRISEANLSFVNYSQIRNANEWTQILLIDQVGILADLYQHGDFAFVGGSFKDKVHSVMEPLLTGLPVIVGPFHENNREALKFKMVYDQDQRPLVRIADGAASLGRLITDQITNPSDKDLVKSKVLESTGATFHIVQKIATEL